MTTNSPDTVVDWDLPNIDSNTNPKSSPEVEEGGSTKTSEPCNISISTPYLFQTSTLSNVCNNAVFQDYNSEWVLCPEARTEDTAVEENTVPALAANEATDDDPDATNNDVSNFIFIPQYEIMKLKVDELRLEL